MSKAELKSEVRSKSLDILRAAAIFLVILFHAKYFSCVGVDKIFTVIRNFFERGGWIGVDLFFVLSGFLIAGLLFKEHQRFNCISLKNFYIRRGLKIYPPFYVFLLISILIPYVNDSLMHKEYTFNKAGFLSEIFFMQDYFWGIWNHTWSLGVEEKFYLLLPVLLILLARNRKYENQSFRSIPMIFIYSSILMTGLRFIRVLFHGPSSYTAFHERMDALFFGVVIAYYYHYHPIEFKNTATKYKYPLIACATILIAPCYIIIRNVNIKLALSVSGTGFLYLGCGMILVAFIGHEFSNGALSKAIAYIGTHSYSIYLWHMPVAIWGPESINRLFHIRLNWYYSVFIYIAGSIAIGIFMSKIIEFPVLRLRDRLFPSRSAGN